MDSSLYSRNEDARRIGAHASTQMLTLILTSETLPRKYSRWTDAQGFVRGRVPQQLDHVGVALHQSKAFESAYATLSDVLHLERIAMNGHESWSKSHLGGQTSTPRASRHHTC